MNYNNYIIIIGSIIIIIYFAYISKSLREWINNILDLIDILPLPEILKKIIFYFRFIKDKKTINTHNIYKNNKRNVSALQKKMIASNQEWRCMYCKNILDYTYEIDHILPLFKGGTNNNNNLQALCRNCHGIKTIKDNLS